MSYKSFTEQVRKLVQHPELIRETVSINIFDRVQQEKIDERKRLGYDSHFQKMAEDWSILGSQVVGAETF